MIPGFYGYFSRWLLPRMTTLWSTLGRLLLGLGVLLVFLLGWGVGAIASDLPPETTPTPQNSPQPLSPATNLQADDIAAEKVSQFVRAYLQVLDLIERREGDLQSAETQLESVQLQQNIEAEAFEIIEATGLTLQEYLQLLGLSNTDPEFGERVATQLQEAPLE